MSLLRGLANGWKPGSLAAKFRQERLAVLAKLLRDIPAPVKLLDVGGQEEFWKALDLSQLPKLEITFLNIFPFTPTIAGASSVTGDARDMRNFADGEYDVVFSNSVIEHVGGLREQRKMAEECVRVGKIYYIQTPSRWFPMEPHFLLPFFQFLPLRLRAFSHAHFSLGWWQKAAGKYEAREEVESIRLLTEGELRYIFPRGTIWKERLWGMTKSYLVYGTNETGHPQF